MSEQKIWNKLREIGMTEEGTAAVMGNLYCESLLRSNNVEDRSQISDDEYTRKVDSGEYPRLTFTNDRFGYGLAQWTAPERKAGLYSLAKGRLVSIADVDMQLDWLHTELVNSYGSLLSFLRVTDDLYTATERFCKEFERPAINNTATRYKHAQRYLSTYTGTSQPVLQSAVFKTAETQMPLLRKGDKGIPVGWLQLALIKHGCLNNVPSNLDCDFGSRTAAALKLFKVAHNLDDDGKNKGVTTVQTWEALYK